MAQEQGNREKRFSIEYFDGVNNTVQHMLAKRTELSHSENARSRTIGILEKREGQTKFGTLPSGSSFFSRANYGLTRFPNTGSNTSRGIFRVTDTSSETFTFSVYDYVHAIDVPFPGSNTKIYLFAYDEVFVTEPSISTYTNVNTIHLDGTSSSGLASIYALTNTGAWTILTDGGAQGLVGALCDFANADGNLVVVNRRDLNRMIASDGATVTVSSEAGSLYNSPPAAKVAFYKNRIYLGDILRGDVQYKTTIIRSSYPLGILTLVNGDVTSSTTVPVADTKYFYTASGMNSYDIYRGGTKITTITVTAIQETSITVSGAVTLLSSDEIWIAGTFDGAKQWRWPNNPSVSGRDVKQYDSFKLSGGDEDEITMFTTIGNVLLAGNKNSLLSWNDYTLESFDLGIGCASKRGGAKLLGTLYFIHYSGVFATTGGVPNLISRKVSRYIEGATKDGIENAAAGVKGLSAFFAIGDVTLYRNDGSISKVLPDVCLEYNIADQNWYVHTNVNAEEFLNFIDSDGSERILMADGGTGKYVKEFLSGSTDDGNAIFFRADTSSLQLMKEFETFANPLSVITEVERGTLMKVFVGLDDDPFYEVEGTVNKGISKLKVRSKDADLMTPPLCRRMKVSYRDSSKQLCKIVQMAIVYLPTLMDESQ